MRCSRRDVPRSWSRSSTSWRSTRSRRISTRRPGSGVRARSSCSRGATSPAPRRSRRRQSTSARARRSCSYRPSRSSCSRRSPGRTGTTRKRPQPANRRSRSTTPRAAPPSPSGYAAAPAAARPPPPADLTPLGGLRRALRELVAHLLGLLQRRLLVLEVFLQQREHVLLAHRLGIRDQAFVDGDLVVLRLADAADDHLVVEAVVDHLQVRLALLLEPLDRRAGRVVRLLAERRERLLEVAHVALRLLEVVLQRLLQLRILRVLPELREHLEDRVLHLQRRAELEQVELARCFDRLSEQRHS